MARYVVIAFEDNDLAEDFARGEPREYPYGSWETVALVPAPTVFCDDPFGQHGVKKAGYFLGPKYGWWVCAGCGKPTEAWGKQYNSVISSGKNLLEVESATT